MAGRREFLERMVALANLIPGYVLAKETIAMYEKLLVPKLGWDRLCELLELAMLERKGSDRGFPTPRDLLSLHEPQDDPESQAIVAANGIVEAIAKDGHTNADRARARMGSLGWAVVQAEGGWWAVTAKVKEDQIPTFRAQWTKLALSILKRGPAPRPALPQPRGTPAPELQSFGDTMKRIADHTKK